jgi:hypothetical protein
LTFTATIPAPNEYVLGSLAGWHIHLDHLADALDGRPVDWPRWDQEHRPTWAKIRQSYGEAD